MQVVDTKADPERVRQQAAAIQLLVLDVDGVLTDGSIQLDADGRECKTFNVKDGYGIRRVLDAGIEVAIISGRQSTPVEKRAADLGIRHVHLGIRNKIAVFHDLLEQLSVTADAVACVGDDTPDAECMSVAGLAIAVADAHSDLDAVADWRTTRNGGRGAVREVCDLLLSARS
ncbi:MAG: HAD hydrolase family protein [Gammaproteobacteria bacterium]|nr:HAD hydrolase family protein [Gammaproteobacteria bacterium]NND54857.1 HAD hydrolase family protein [Gammaproteobacteria bacterium]